MQFKAREALRSLAARKVTIVCDAIPYAFENVPLKKIFNWLTVEVSLLAKPEKPPCLSNRPCRLRS